MCEALSLSSWRDIVVVQRPSHQSTGAAGRRDASVSEGTGRPSGAHRRGNSWPEAKQPARGLVTERLALESDCAEPTRADAGE
jgi:hypothetical protein